MKKYCLFLLSCLCGCALQQQNLSGEYKMLNAYQNADISIVFEGTGFAGSSGVNRYFGNFDKTNSKIKLNVAGSTMMMGPQHLMQAEQTYLQNLQEVEEFELKDKTLVLKNANGLELCFERE